MEDYTKWVSLWKIAIAVTIIKYSDFKFDLETFSKTDAHDILLLRVLLFILNK